MRALDTAVRHQYGPKTDCVAIAKKFISSLSTHGYDDGMLDSLNSDKRDITEREVVSW